MHYDCYPLLLDYMERTIAKDVWVKSQGKKVGKENRSILSALIWLYEQNRDLADTMDTIIMAEEYYWLETNRTVVFPESNEVLTRLLSSKVDLKNTAPIQMPHSSFVLAMPRKFEYKSVHIPSVLISWCDSDERDDIIGNFSEDVLGKRYKRIPMEPQFEEEQQLAITWRYRDVDLPKELQDKNQLATFRFCVPCSRIPELLRCESPKAMADFMGTLKYKDVLSTNEADNLRQFYIAKLVLMVGLYSSSFADALKPGYPGKEPKHLEPRLHKPWSKLKLGMSTSNPTENDERSYHYRSWHFRQLMDKRYYQGEHAEKPIGSRVVFIKDSMVGRKIEAETLSDV